jgi:hypothetical protein
MIDHHLSLESARTRRTVASDLQRLIAEESRMSLRCLGMPKSPLWPTTLAVCLAVATLLVVGGCPQDGPDLTECSNRLDLFHAAASAAIDASQACGAGNPCPDFCAKLQEMRDLLQLLQDGGCFTGTAGQAELGAQLRAQVEQLEVLSAGICS